PRLHEPADERREEGRDVAAVLRLVDRPQQARSQRHLDRVLVPAPPHHSAAAEREHELLTRGVQAARGAVEAVEDDALHGGVETAGAPVAWDAWIRDLRRGLV